MLCFVCLFFSRSCSLSQTSWHFWSFITSSSPSRSTLLWRCRSFSAPFSSAGTWTFTTRRATRRPRSTPPTSMRSWGRYGLEVLERVSSVHHLYSSGKRFSDTLKIVLDPIYCHLIFVGEVFYVFQNVWLHYRHKNKWKLFLFLNETKSFLEQCTQECMCSTG